MASYVEQENLAHDPAFVGRVKVAACSAAIAVQGEAPGAPNHANRAAYAKAVLNAPEMYAPLFALAICAYDPTLTSSSQDAQIQGNVNAVWNALAGTL